MNIDNICCEAAYDPSISMEMKVYLIDYALRKISGIKLHDNEVKSTNNYQMRRIGKVNRDDFVHSEVKITKSGRYIVTFDVERGTPKQIREKVIAAVREVIVGTSIVEQKTKGPGRFYVSEGEHSIQDECVAAVLIDIERQLRAFTPLFDIAQQIFDDSES